MNQCKTCQTDVPCSSRCIRVWQCVQCGEMTGGGITSQKKNKGIAGRCRSCGPKVLARLSWWNSKDGFVTANAGSGDGERKTKPTRQMTSDPLPASVLFGDWVPCSQSLPPDQVSVLVVSTHGMQVVMYRERGVWVESLTTAFWEPTHWTPLPPSPDETNGAAPMKNSTSSESSGASAPVPCSAIFHHHSHDKKNHIPDRTGQMLCVWVHEYPLRGKAADERRHLHTLPESSRQEGS